MKKRNLIYLLVISMTALGGMMFLSSCALSQEGVGPATGETPDRPSSPSTSY